MDETSIFARLAMALAIGLLLGLERGWHGRKESAGLRVAGIRTFALTGLLGGVSGWLAVVTTPLFPALGLLALGGLMAVTYWVGTRDGRGRGLTTEIAVLLTFVLGAIVTVDESAAAPAAAVAVVAVVLLSMKPALHRWVRHIKRFELEAALKLALISVVILPVLPNRGFGPGAILNPYTLWWAVVIVAGLSFVGYVAIRLVGARFGILATGLFGGLASSTSTTLALSRLVRANDAFAPLAAAGIVVAGSVTFLRILALVAVFEPSLLALLAGPMGIMAATGLAGAALTHFLAGDRQEAEPDAIEGVGNPLELTAALTFGAVLAAVLFGVHYLQQWLGTQGVYAASALSGLTDVDALTISVSRLVGQNMDAAHGAVAIFIAASVNTVVKAGISLAAGNRRLGLRVGAIYLAVVLIGGASLWLSF